LRSRRYIVWEQGSNYFSNFIAAVSDEQLPVRPDRYTSTVVPFENVGKAIEVTLLSITKAEMSCGVINLSIECTIFAIEEALHI